MTILMNHIHSKPCQLNRSGDTAVFSRHWPAEVGRVIRCRSRTSADRTRSLQFPSLPLPRHSTSEYCKSHHCTTSLMHIIIIERVRFTWHRLNSYKTTLQCHDESHSSSSSSHAQLELYHASGKLREKSSVLSSRLKAGRVVEEITSTYIFKQKTRLLTHFDLRLGFICPVNIFFLILWFQTEHFTDIFQILL